MSRISLVQLAGSVRKFNRNRPFICPILKKSNEGAEGEPADVRSQWITGFTYRESGVASTARVEILQCVKQRNDTGLRFNPSSYFQWL